MFGANFLSLIFASRQSRLSVVRNEIKSLDVLCDSDSFNVTVTLEHPFKGMLSAKEFSQECNSYGTSNNSVSLNLPTFGCGLRLTTKKGRNGEVFMHYSVTLALQQDRHLRQIADQEIHVSCRINAEEFALESKSIINQVETNLMEDMNMRNGRMRHDESWNIQMKKNILKMGPELYETLKTAKAWMEIIQGTKENYNGVSDNDVLQVGELAKLVVKSTLPVGIGWKVVNCVAHDGLGDSSQKLLDDTGCPIDDQLMPKPTYGPVEGESLNRYQEAISVFPAFKFPDRDRLHLTCSLLLCRGACHQDVECNDTQRNDNDRSGKELNDEDNNVLDEISLFNSVEVLATTMNEYYKTEEYHESKDSSFTFKGIPGDETLCISYNKVAIAFCTLGLLFLIAAVLATGGLLKTRASSNALSIYTRSIFSSSSGTGSSQYGSKLLHDQSSFGFSSTGGLQYGRIL